MTKQYPIGEEMQMIADQTAILATYDQHCRAARKTTPGGILLRPDLVGIWKRVAGIHDTTPEHVREVVEARHGNIDKLGATA
jgi:uncharacterized protein